MEPKIPFAIRKHMRESAKHIYMCVPDYMLQWVAEARFEEYYKRGYNQGFNDAQQTKGDTDVERGSHDKD